MSPRSKPERSRARPGRLALAALLAAAALVGCRQDMHDQRKIEPLEATPFFADGRGSRKPVDGTVARGKLKDDRHLHEGRTAAGELVDELPMPVNKDLLLRGRERFDIYCSPCHARTGDGDGMVVRRGFQKPPTFHRDELRKAKLGHLFEVISKGLGAMPAYAAQIKVEDRWAIVAYVRALQLSRSAKIEDVPEPQRADLLKQRGAKGSGGTQ
jgi:mono/diheme cytochrome c family protein